MRRRVGVRNGSCYEKLVHALKLAYNNSRNQMILVSHIVISGILGSKTQNYFLAAIIGLASHYVLDAIPHWDYLSEEFQSRVKTDKEFVKNKKFWRELGKDAIDGLAGLILLIMLIGLYKNLNITSALIGAFFGILQ